MCKLKYKYFPILTSEVLCDVFEQSWFLQREVVSLSPNPQTGGLAYSSSAVHDCLFNIFAASLHIWRPTPPSAIRGDAPCHGDRNPQMVTYRIILLSINALWYNINKFNMNSIANLFLVSEGQLIEVCMNNCTVNYFIFVTNLKEDIFSRWKSTYFMFESLMKTKRRIIDLL